MIELNKKFESDDELAIFCARVLCNYCYKTQDCEKCIFGIDVGKKKKMCFFTDEWVPVVWNCLMKECGVIKRDEEEIKLND